MLNPFGYHCVFQFFFNFFQFFQCVHLDSSDLIVHSRVATTVREMEHVTMSLEFVTKDVKKD